MRRSEADAVGVVVLGAALGACAVPLHDDGGGGGAASDGAAPLPVAGGCRPFRGLASSVSGAVHSTPTATGLLFVVDDATVAGADVPALALEAPAGASLDDCLGAAALAGGTPSSALPASLAPQAMLTVNGATSLFYAEAGGGYGVTALGATAGTPLWTSDRPAYGTAAVVSGDDAYVMGCVGARFLDGDCFVARVPAGSLGDPSAYAYSVGGGRWTARVGDAFPVTSGGTDVDVAWLPDQRRWLLAYVPPLGTTITVRSGLSPAGPWSAPIDVATCDLADPDMFCAGLRLHPAVAAPPGTIALSYAPATFSADAGARRAGNPDAWWPRIVALPLPSLP
jgi:hypothetical protein